jgi:hypothetical protein
VQKDVEAFQQRKDEVFAWLDEDGSFKKRVKLPALPHGAS